MHAVGRPLGQPRRDRPPGGPRSGRMQGSLSSPPIRVTVPGMLSSRRCEHSSPAAPASSARTSSTRWSRAGDEVPVIDDLSTRPPREPRRGARAGASSSRATSATPRRSPRRSSAPAARSSSTSRPRSTSAARSPTRASTSTSTSAARSTCSRRAREPGSGASSFASTGGAIYGEGDGRDLPLDEAAESPPDAPYGQSKFAAEGYLALYRAAARARRRSRCASATSTARARTRTARPAWSRSSAARCSTAARRRVFGDGEQTRDYVYVGDVVARVPRRRRARTRRRRTTSAPGAETSVIELGRARSPRGRSRVRARARAGRASARCSGSRSTRRWPGASSAGGRATGSTRASS